MPLDDVSDDVGGVVGRVMEGDADGDVDEDVGGWRGSDGVVEGGGIESRILMTKCLNDTHLC